jgi:sarcosine oxidase
LENAASCIRYSWFHPFLFSFFVMKCYDCIVIGFGGMGSAALREAARLGWSVLGIDRFGPAHDRGSSHGQSRIIRRAYFEHPSYVPLTQRAFEMWDELTCRHRTSPDVKELITPAGLLQVGHPDSNVIRGIQASAKEFELAIETFAPAEIEERLPIFRIPADQIGLFEPTAAILRVELCVAAMISQAAKLGAEIIGNTTVTGWSVSDDGNLSVQTDEGRFRSRRLVIAGGAWSASLLPDLDLKLQVLRKQQFWFQLDRVDQKLINRFPSFLIEQADGSCYYGIPEIDYLGMKVCEHSGGKPVADPAMLNRELETAELERVQKFMKDYLDFGHSRLVHHSACMYSMTPDGHFIVDQYPDLPQVVFAAGMSGHGFKFAPVIGRYLIDLLQGQREPEFDFLKFDRLELQKTR